MDWLDFIKVMIVDEKGAKAKYGVAATKAADPALKAMFRELQDEEEVHVQIHEGKLEALKKKARAG
jgi:rubrerythrin